jgi:preprotein translocase subunit SecF
MRLNRAPKLQNEALADSAENEWTGCFTVLAAVVAVVFLGIKSFDCFRQGQHLIGLLLGTSACLLLAAGIALLWWRMPHPPGRNPPSDDEPDDTIGPPGSPR